VEGGIVPVFGVDDDAFDSAPRRPADSVDQQGAPDTSSLCRWMYGETLEVTTMTSSSEDCISHRQLSRDRTAQTCNRGRTKGAGERLGIQAQVVVEGCVVNLQDSRSSRQRHPPQPDSDGVFASPRLSRRLEVKDQEVEATLDGESGFGENSGPFLRECRCAYADLRPDLLV
jgi:hypothetical protein